MNRRDVVAAGFGAVVATLVLVGVHQWRDTRSSESLGASSVADGGSVATSSEQWLEANQNLADTVKHYKDQLAKNEVEKQTIEHSLKQAEAKLALLDGDGAVVRSEFDLSQDDWARLAAEGVVKVRWSCFYQKGWQPSPETLAELGLAPADGPALASAVERSYFRVWGVLEPLCASVVGSPELAHRLGVRVCSSIVNESAVEAAERDRKMVAQVRAGLRAEPKQADLDPTRTDARAHRGDEELRA